jgi:Protein of unknown function (DUF3263)
MSTDPLDGDARGTGPDAAPDAGDEAGTPAAGGGTPGTDGTREAPAPDGAPGAQEPVTAVTLRARERDVLAFERQWWRYGGAKEEAIRERFGLTATRYYQVLNAVIDRPEALAADPLLVRRLRRMRSARQRGRSRRVLGSEGQRS